jgi:glycosyltransferase involved in cell wall biosynthesis
MKILYLYSELMGYQIPILREYVTKYNAEVHVIHWDQKKITPYKPPAFSNIFYYNRSDYSVKQLKEFVIKINPDIIYISGWMDKGYLVAVRPLRKLGIPVVSGMDDIWLKTLRQRIASILFPPFRKLFFSHAWVAGPYQYEFAKRLGFKNNEIIHNCLSADIEIFNLVYKESIEKKKEKYPHRFFYAGRLESNKGIGILIQAWKGIRENKKDWELCIIGNGSLHDYVASNSEIITLDFMQPENLVREIENAGCYILPSIYERWGVVLHEFSAAGLPIICSSFCGSAPFFVTHNFNGYVFRTNNIEDLEKKMLRIIDSTDEELIKMSENSHLNGQKITPQMSAASFMSILE